MRDWSQLGQLMMLAQSSRELQIKAMRLIWLLVQGRIFQRTGHTCGICRTRISLCAAHTFIMGVVHSQLHTHLHMVIVRSTIAAVSMGLWGAADIGKRECDATG